jgi:hypothetical protein
MLYELIQFFKIVTFTFSIIVIIGIAIAIKLEGFHKTLLSVNHFSCCFYLS